MNIFKKIKLFRAFKKGINDSKIELKNTFNVRVDGAYRLYTVLNIPEELIGEAYSLKKSDIDRISENFIKEYTSQISKVLNKNGLNELYSIYDIEKVDKYSYLIVIGYRLFKSQKYYNWLYYGVIPTITIASIISLILFL